LYIVFRRDDGRGADQLKDATKQPWTAPKNARPGDVALFYLTGLSAGIHAIGQTTTVAKPDEPGDWATGDRSYFFARHARLRILPHPLTLQEIRERFPSWKRWSNLRGVHVHIVPEGYRAPLADILARTNPSARNLLSPWLPNEPGTREPTPQLTVRAIGTVRRRLRDSTFGRQVRNASGGECAACRSRTNYDALRILEAAHIRPAEHNGSDTLANALALCPNHHALFDEGFWTVDGKRIVLRQGLATQVRRTFRRALRCDWTLDPGELEWHRLNVFSKHAG